MSIGDILDSAIKLYRENFVLLFGITAIVYGPCYLAVNVADSNLIPQKEQWTRWAIEICGFILQMIAFTVASGAASKAISDRYLGRTATIAGSYRHVLARFWPLMLTWFQAVLLIIVGCCLLLVPGILAMLYATFVSQVVVLENQYYMSGFRRSRMLFGFAPGKTLLVMLLAGVLVAVISIVGEALVSFLGRSTSGTLVGLHVCYQTLLSLFLVPVQLIVVTLLYYDLRIRKEGYDLQVLAEDLGYPSFPSPES